MHKNRVLVFIVLFFLSIFAFGEEKYISVKDFSTKVKAGVSFEPISESIRFSRGNRSVTCNVGKTIVVFDSAKIDFAHAPIKRDGLVFLSHDMANIIDGYLSVESFEPEFTIGAILIDPGHGGKDPGAIGKYSIGGKERTVYEKDIALQVGLELQNLLKQTYPNKKILMTRTKDVYPTLGDRVDMANSIKLSDKEAVIFISIHVNSSFNRKAKGYEVWYLPKDYRRTLIEKGSVSKDIQPILNSMLEEEYSMESILIAKNILKGLDDQIGEKTKSRGLKENAWFVVRNAKMPSVLVELGFITNPDEIKLLNSARYLKQSAVGIYNGLVTFISQFEHYGF